MPPILIARPEHERLSKLAAGVMGRLPHVGQFLMEELDRAEIVERGAIPSTVATMNARVEFRDDETGRSRSVLLVYPGEQDIDAGRISILTPVGAALIGLSEGQSIAWEAPDGAWRRLTVTRVEQAGA
jgi:regulator of nucleoside diphosphate kinase